MDGTQCGTGDACLNGICDSNPNPMPAECVFNTDCPTVSATCINTVCHAACSDTTACVNPADFCDQGICQPDWRRKAECTLSTECPNAGDQCVNGACATRCMADPDCAGNPHGTSCVMGYCGSK